MRTNRCPAMRHRVFRLALLDHARRISPTIGSQEFVAGGVETRQRRGAGKISKVIAAFTVFGLVVDHAVFNLNFPDAEVPLEVGHVVVGIPQAELYEGKQRQIGFCGDGYW